DAGQQGNIQLQQGMGNAVKADGKEAGIGTDDFKFAFCCGVSLRNSGYICIEEPVDLRQLLKKSFGLYAVSTILAFFRAFKYGYQAVFQLLKSSFKLERRGKELF